jgi:hypothetical protein
MAVVFKITKDALYEELNKNRAEGEKEPNVAGSYHFDLDDDPAKDKESIKAFDAAEKVRFRLLDDDRVVYYYGLIPKSAMELNDGGEELLRPLNWGEWYAGCAHIQHYVKNEKTGKMEWQYVVG